MKRILVVNTAGLGTGGITTHMLNYLKYIASEHVDVDIVATVFWENSVLDDFRKIGCRVIYLPNRKSKLIKYRRELQKILRENDYDVIHVHGNSATMYIELEIAKKMGVKTRIAHCHNTSCNHKILHQILTLGFKRSYTVALACSKEAGEWIFGKEFEVLHNAFDYDKFRYEEKTREELRKLYDIKDGQAVLGIVGNLNDQKNPLFSLEVYRNCRDYEPFKFLVVGEGKYMDDLMIKSKEYQMDGDIFFTGIRKDIQRWYQMIDFFLFPSVWEGLGIALLEAQAAGCLCFASDKIPMETKMTEEIKYLPLNNPMLWVEAIIEMKKFTASEYRMFRSMTACERLSKDYDLTKDVMKLKDIYRLSYK